MTLNPGGGGELTSWGGGVPFPSCIWTYLSAVFSPTETEHLCSCLYTTLPVHVGIGHMVTTPPHPLDLDRQMLVKT